MQWSPENIFRHLSKQFKAGWYRKEAGQDHMTRQTHDIWQTDNLSHKKQPIRIKLSSKSMPLLILRSIIYGKSRSSSFKIQACCEQCWEYVRDISLYKWKVIRRSTGLQMMAGASCHIIVNKPINVDQCYSCSTEMEITTNKIKRHYWIIHSSLLRLKWDHSTVFPMWKTSSQHDL